MIEEVSLETTLLCIYVENENDSEVYKNINLAKKYSSVQYDDNPSDYDEHFEDMVWYREGYGKLDTFIFYLEEYCGYEILPFSFEYEIEY